MQRHVFAFDDAEAQALGRRRQRIANGAVDGGKALVVNAFQFLVCAHDGALEFE